MPDTGDSEQDTVTTFKSRRRDLQALGFNSFFYIIIISFQTVYLGELVSTASSSSNGLWFCI